MKRIVVAVALLAVACGSEWNMPFSNANPTLPSTVQFGSSGDSPGPSVEHGSAVQTTPHNAGTQVWLVPAPASDLLRMVREPDLWPRARARVDVFGFYMAQAYHHEGFECGTPCGPNTYPALMAAVPGGAFKWIADQDIAIAVEAPVVKEHSCTLEDLRGGAVVPTVIALDNLEKAGAPASYVSMDEPFAAGTTGYAGQSDPFGSGYRGCGLAPGEVAVLIQAYASAVHEKHPAVQIGLTEPYPHFSVDQIISYVLELERAGVPVPFLHVDMHLQREVREQRDVSSDLQRIQEFCRARGIPLGVIIFGEDGTSNGAYATEAWATAVTISSALGVTEHTVFQSWAESQPGNLNSLKHTPDNVPETDATTHTGLLLRLLQYLRVPAAGS